MTNDVINALSLANVSNPNLDSFRFLVWLFFDLFVYFTSWTCDFVLFAYEDDVYGLNMLGDYYCEIILCCCEIFYMLTIMPKRKSCGWALPNNLDLPHSLTHSCDSIVRASPSR